MSGVSHSALMLSYGSAFEVSYLQRATSLTGFAIGDAASSRRILMLVHWREDEDHESLSSATIGGVSATIHMQGGHSGGSTGFGVAFISAVVPTGTTATIVLNFSGTVSVESISGWRLVNASNSSPSDTASDSTAVEASTVSGNLDIPEGGAVFAGYSSSTGAMSNAVSWTGATEEYDTGTGGGGIRVSAAWSSGMSAESNRLVRAAISSEGDAGNQLLVLSWV